MQKAHQRFLSQRLKAMKSPDTVRYNGKNRNLFSFFNLSPRTILQSSTMKKKV